MTLQKLGVTVIVKIYTAFSVFQTLFLSSLCGLSHLILTSVLWGGNNYELLHRWGNRGIVRFRNLPKATQLGSGSAGTPTPTLCARVSSQPLYNAACSHRAGGGGGHLQGGGAEGRRARWEAASAVTFQVFLQSSQFFMVNILMYALKKTLILIYENFIYVSQTTKLK